MFFSVRVTTKTSNDKINLKDLEVQDYNSAYEFDACIFIDEKQWLDRSVCFGLNGYAYAWIEWNYFHLLGWLMALKPFSECVWEMEKKNSNHIWMVEHATS